MASRCEGFTLLEVLVAVAIFALGSVFVLGIRSNSYKEARSALDFNTARYLLQKQMEAVLLDPQDYEDGDEGAFEDEEDRTLTTRYSWRVGIEEIDLLGGSSDEDDTSGSSRSRRDRNGSKSDQGGNKGGGGGLFGDGSGDDEQEEVKVWKVTVYIYYPGHGDDGLTHIAATTYLPGEAIESEKDDKGGF